MPNTLAHVGVQGLLTRFVVRDADPKWIYLGCVIPDVPWILQRAVLFALPGINPDALRYYVDGQASFLGCLILAAALALLSRSSGKLFMVLGLNACLHLLLDACQTKWANGVHFAAPFSWELTSWGFFWPESLINYVLTGGGLVYILVYWRIGLRQRPGMRRPTGLRLVGFITLMVVYFTVPLLFIQGPEKADNHYLSTLRTPHNRTGRYVELDRAHCAPVGGRLQCSASDEMQIEGIDLQKPATISLRGTFITENVLRATESHIHLRWFRNSASYLGLTLIIILWVMAGVRYFYLVVREDLWRIGRIS